MAAVFLIKLKVPINEGFSWGVSKISKVGECQKGGSNIMQNETSLSSMYKALQKFIVTLKFSLDCHNVNRLMSILLYLINLIKNLTFA